jgi:hypothetical protein
MAVLQQLVRELRESIMKQRTPDSPPFFPLSSLPAIHALDARIAVECNRLNVKFPDMPINAGELLEFGFTKIPYCGVTRQGVFGWYLMPTPNWLQALPDVPGAGDGRIAPQKTARGERILESQSRRRGPRA